MPDKRTQQPEDTKTASGEPMRSSSVETEIKFQADRPTFERVMASRWLQGTSMSPEREQVSTYFDTPACDLQKSGMALRVRRKGRSLPVLCVKWVHEPGGDLFSKGEAEVPTREGEPDITLFAPAVRDRLASVLGNQPLAPLFQTIVRRRTGIVRHGASEIELALDDGMLIANEQGRPVIEIELELKSGTATDLLDLACGLAVDCGLSLAFEPKAARGYRLAQQAGAQPQKARPLRLPGSSSFDDVIAAVLANCLAHFIANWACLRESDAPESIHQLRVALRRLRSGLGIFRKRIALPELESIRTRARDIASALGPARECDAFVQNALAGPLRDQPERQAAAAPLLAAVASRRQESYAAARRIIDAPSTSLFVLEVQDILARRSWRTPLGADDPGLLTSPARVVAGEVLDRLRRRALKRGKNLPDMPDDDRHELRIALKNLRYAAEFFGPLYGEGKAVRGFLRLLADLQEDLGAHNDAATSEAFIASLHLEADADAPFAAGYLLGYYRHATLVADRQLTRKWKSFRRAGAFWT